jgi:hypothetical protein
MSARLGGESREIRSDLDTDFPTEAYCAPHVEPTALAAPGIHSRELEPRCLENRTDDPRAHLPRAQAEDSHAIGGQLRDCMILVLLGATMVFIER